MVSELPADFDPETYLKLNPDVAEAGVDPAEHYLEYGVKEGRYYLIDPAHDFRHYLSRFSTDEPSDQAAVDIFEGMWSTRFKEIESGGTFDAMIDARVTWLLEQLGDVAGFNILELGPLEGGHTVSLEAAGARVLAIEANMGAFLRCLVIKNYFNLEAKFLYGDFTKFNVEEQRFDLVFACGVLYHMKNPVEMLEKFAACSDRLFIWTHYFEPDLSKWSPLLSNELDRGKWKLDNVINRLSNGVTVRMVHQSYLESLGWDGFCGGTEDYSYWIFKEDLLALLESLGYRSIKIAFDNVQHQNGPSLALLAERTS
ncbi:MAG: methyltransferase domain-containing protein [Pseudomonadota bacterium]